MSSPVPSPGLSLPVRPPGTVEALLPFGALAGSSEHSALQSVTLVASAHCNFLPLGLFLRGATKDTFVERLHVGNQAELAVGFEPIPGLYFQTNYSFDDLRELADVGRLELSTAQRAVIEMREATFGTTVSLHLRGPFESAVLWGLIYREGRPVRCIHIEGVCSKPDASCYDSYRGQVIEHRLRGHEITFEVQAPSEDAVTSLLAAHLSSARR